MGLGFRVSGFGFRVYVISLASAEVMVDAGGMTKPPSIDKTQTLWLHWQCLPFRVEGLVRFRV